ncbi:hypothetical protein I4U23_000608 [Adineta vaga]|nr:hypothetical protein I4U23_000608 [Adineta vaga]
MNNDSDVNPFADPSIQQATQQTFTNQQTLSEYNPFANATVGSKITQSNTDNTPVSFTQQLPPSYASAGTSIPPQQTNRVDFSQFERQQAELEQREKRLAERERELRNLQAPQREKNFPPLPDWSPLRPCFYQDINVEIPPEFQKWVRYLYYLWLLYSATLALNMIAAFSYLMVDKEGAATFGLSIVYFVLFIPCSYACWFRPIYRAFRQDSASSFMIFFLIFFIQIVITILQFFGVANLGCGFILMVKLFSSGGSKIIVGIIVMIVTLSFAIIAVADGLLLIKVHRLYRQSGATLEQAQREFQSAFVNNPTVRGAAREVATAGINQTTLAVNMDSIDIKKKTDEKIVDPSIRTEAQRYSLPTRFAFLPDKVIGELWYFRLLTLSYYYIFIYFHGFEIIGMEKIDRKQGCLFISRHSTHNAEIQGAIVCTYHKTGRVIRSLIHRQIMLIFSFLRLMGCVPGKRDTAVSLLNSRFWVAVIPGGAEEAMVGHENAYKVCWPENRKGFVHVATEAGVPIIPTFMANQEEMRWNPILFLWNLFGLGHLYSYILKLEIPLLTPLLHSIGTIIWFSMTWIQIPIPAQLTLYIGDPVQYDMSKDTIDDVVERSRTALQALINQYQPQGKSYSNAIKQRIESVTKYWTEEIFNTIQKKKSN